MANIRNIPEPVKRIVRQRCGFGCIICGHPIIEYHHINEWAVVKEHQPDNITLLCPSHHSDVTANRIPISTILHANKNPYCVLNQYSSPYNIFHSQDKDYSVLIGSLCFHMIHSTDIFSQLTPLMIDHMRIIQLVKIENKLGLFINIFDKNNKLVLRVYNNELVLSTGLWDITYISNKLTLKENKQNLLCEMEFNTPNGLTITKANLYYNNHHVVIDKKGIQNQNIHLSELDVYSPVGVGIGSLPPNTKAAVYIHR
ncbi:HNH endonuclease signature motif containing protein [Youngiibacter multivorans]|uniref:Trigger factor n=1 Tax=Youngiibacter multivorans TaxID=937251 RepID=A0ABS4G746_9CLOT|nr:HNH endonuclease signature motif containing protein [Youngiibacter multivorans]MBP1920385.1 trigger factor [Youngiibacter multivorans]